MPISRAPPTVGDVGIERREIGQIAARRFDDPAATLVSDTWAALSEPALAAIGDAFGRPATRLATQIGFKLRGAVCARRASIGCIRATSSDCSNPGGTGAIWALPPGREHDAETIERADYVIDLGPGGYRLGGEWRVPNTGRVLAYEILTGRAFVGRDVEIPALTARRRAIGQ